MQRLLVGWGLLALLALLVAPAPVAGAPQFALKRGSTFFLDYDGNAVPDATLPYGAPTDIGVMADFNGDTISDLAVFRNGLWFVSLFNDSVANLHAAFGTAGDLPLAADVDGDGRADLVLYRPSTGFWYVNYQRNGTYDGVPDVVAPFGGGPDDLPVLGDFDGDGAIDRAIYRDGFWFIDLDWSGTTAGICAFGGLPGDVPIAVDVDDDGIADLGVFRGGTWYFDTNCDGIPDRIFYFGAAGDRPFAGAFDTAGSIFVGATAPPGGNGSQKSPLRTIPTALGLATDGTSIRIAAGTYPDPIAFSHRTNLTFIGAGSEATHLTGSGADAFTAVLSSGIDVRDLHVASPSDRGIINQGSSMTLNRVSTIGNWGHGVLATGYLDTHATLSVFRSRLDQSLTGTGLRFEGGVTASVVGSCVCDNGTSHPAAPGGRGIEVLADSDVTVQSSEVSGNWDGGILVENLTAAASNATVTGSSVQFNGTNGVIFGRNASGTVSHNVIAHNGQRGTPGALTGHNGIELLSGWNGAQMTIDANTLTHNTGNGVLIGSGGTAANPVAVVNNLLDENWLGMTIFNVSDQNTFVLAQGNTFLNTTPLTENQTGLFIQRNPPGDSTVTIGGALASQHNTFHDFLARPAIACNSGTEITACRLSWNTFTNSPGPGGSPVFQCNCPD